MHFTAGHCELELTTGHARRGTFGSRIWCKTYARTRMEHLYRGFFLSLFVCFSICLNRFAIIEVIIIISIPTWRHFWTLLEHFKAALCENDVRQVLKCSSCSSLSNYKFTHMLDDKLNFHQSKLRALQWWKVHYMERPSCLFVCLFCLAVSQFRDTSLKGWNNVQILVNQLLKKNMSNTFTCDLWSHFFYFCNPFRKKPMT